MRSIIANNASFICFYGMGPSTRPRYIVVLGSRANATQKLWQAVILSVRKREEKEWKMISLIRSTNDVFGRDDDRNYETKMTHFQSNGVNKKKICGTRGTQPSSSNSSLTHYADYADYAVLCGRCVWMMIIGFAYFRLRFNKTFFYYRKIESERHTTSH